MTGVPIGPSSIVRSIVEQAAAHAEVKHESIVDFRKRMKISTLGFTPEFFEGLRDRTAEPEIRL